MVATVRSQFVARGADGDFAWMIEQPEYADALFIFNDNELQFYEHQRALGSDHSCGRGGGNAVIRPYECLNPPRATGIPTGMLGGYDALSPESQRAIDDAIAYLGSLLAAGRYERVIYSWDAQSQTLGTGIFSVNHEVTDYIVEQIELCAAGVVSRRPLLKSSLPPTGMANSDEVGE